MNADTDAIKRSEANLHAILNHADTGYVLYNADLQIVAFNTLAQKFSQILYSKDLVEGKHLLYYFPAERHKILLDITARVLAGEDINYEMCFNVDGHDKWIHVKWLNVKNTENKNWGLILTSKDITESKLAAIEREKITQDLLRRNKALEQFANITSHNLRAPAANIINLIQMIDKAADENEKEQFLDYILSSSNTLIRVIDNINQILEIKQHLNEVKEPVYFEKLVKDIKTSISYLIIKEEAVIRCNFDSSPCIHSINSFLHSIFYNLILNSIKYKRVGVAPEIELSSALNDGKIKLTFSDNGKGIDLNRNGANLFGLYQRFDSSVEGSGLGLFMIKSQIDELGGTISVKSQPGKGTSFVIELAI